MLQQQTSQDQQKLHGHKGKPCQTNALWSSWNPHLNWRSLCCLSLRHGKLAHNRSSLALGGKNWHSCSRTKRRSFEWSDLTYNIWSQTRGRSLMVQWSLRTIHLVSLSTTKLGLVRGQASYQLSNSRYMHLTTRVSLARRDDLNWRAGQEVGGDIVWLCTSNGWPLRQRGLLHLPAKKEANDTTTVRNKTS